MARLSKARMVFLLVVRWSELPAIDHVAQMPKMNCTPYYRRQARRHRLSPPRRLREGFRRCVAMSEFFERVVGLLMPTPPEDIPSGPCVKVLRPHP
ncbi:hypothetical protein C8Q78DRAFT_1037577 [Trametes maxima]|nr:hypothetical protein C8Q78DRAFT_1037577 [Trametes maxima]